jgi:branched-chain amino acid aminotransferase
MSEQWLALDGQLVSDREANVPATGGVLYGYGVFETMRAYAGRVFRLDAHEARLRDGARALAFAVPFDGDELRRAIQAVLDRNGLTGVDAAVRITLEGDPPPLDGEARLSLARWIVTARPLVEYPESLYERGAAAVVAAVRRNETSPLSRLKTLNYLDNLLARRAARAAGADEALMLNTQGNLAEGAASNIFILRGRQLVTPLIDDGALPGVARATVLDLAPTLGLEPLETTLTPDILRAADEAFLTNSLMEVLPLVLLDGAPLAGGKPGPNARRLREAYRAVATPH